MLALLEAMAAAAVQAYASTARAPLRAGQAEPVRIWRLDALVDSCHSYRRGGPELQQLQRR
jgi:hypothetical protein